MLVYRVTSGHRRVNLGVRQFQMSAYRDLSPWGELPVIADNILAVGWLDNSVTYPRGPTPESVYRRLQSFAQKPWQPFIACGYYECGLCQFAGEQRGTNNLYIPFNGKIYVAPELITHYINAHFYQPPTVFCEAVIECPAMDSMDYKRLLIACHGHVLFQSPPA